MQNGRKRRNDESLRRRIDLLRRDAIRHRQENDSSLRRVSIRMRLAQFSRDIEIRTKGHAYTCEWFKRSHCGSLWPRAAVSFPRGSSIAAYANDPSYEYSRAEFEKASKLARRNAHSPWLQRAPAAALCAPLQNRLATSLSTNFC